MPREQKKKKTKENQNHPKKNHPKRAKVQQWMKLFFFRVLDLPPKTTPHAPGGKKTWAGAPSERVSPAQAPRRDRTFLPRSCRRLPGLVHKSGKFWIQSSLGSTKHRRMRRKRLPDPRPIPERVRGPICIRKKCAIWARRRPVPVKNATALRARAVGSGSVDCV